VRDRLIAIRYGQWQRWADSYHGWRNGRAAIPQRPKIPGAVTTPHREALIRLAQDVFAREHLEYGRLVAEPHRKIMAEQARLAVARSALSAARQELDREPKELPEAESARRRSASPAIRSLVVLLVRACSGPESTPTRCLR